MFRIRRFSVIRTASVVALMYLLVIAIVLVPILLLVTAVGTATPGGLGGQDGGLAVAGVLVIGVLAAVFYGVIGWVFTAIACLVYNAVARWTGGIEVQVDRVEPPPAVPLPASWAPPQQGAAGPG